MYNLLKLSYDGKALPAGVVVEKIARPFFSLTSQLTKVPGVSGDLFRRNDLGGKTIEVNLRIIESAPEDVHRVVDELKLFFYKDKPKKLILTDEPDKYELAILSGKIDFTRFIRTGLVKLVFLCPSGLSYSLRPTFGTYNSGTASTPFTVEGVAVGGSHIIVRSLDKAKTIKIDRAAAQARDKVFIDTDLQLVKVKDRLAMKYLHLESVFWDLDPGENPISIEGLQPGYVIEHRKRWL